MATTESNGWKRFWSRAHWWKAVIAVVAYLALYLLAGRALGMAFGSYVNADNLFATPESVFFGLGAPLVVGAVLLVAFALSLGWLKPLFARQPVPSRWWMWIFVVLVAIPIVLRFAGIDYAGYGGPVVAMSFFVGLFIGFTEELLYRGIVVKVLRDAGHREWMVAVVSSLLFALSHSVNLLSGQPIVTVAVTVAFTFGFGLMMYLVMRATGNIVWAMLAHALTDPTTFLAAGGVDSGTGGAHSPVLDLAAPFNFVFVAAALLALIFIRGKATSQAASLS